MRRHELSDEQWALVEPLLPRRAQREVERPPRDAERDDVDPADARAVARPPERMGKW